MFFKRIEGLKLLLSHPRLTNLSINKKDIDGNTPVMLAVKQARYPVTYLGNRYLEVLAADLRVDLDATDNEGRSLEEVAVAYMGSITTGGLGPIISIVAEIFGQKKCLFGSKTVFLGQEVHYYMVYIAYFTELILQICDYAQKRRI